MEKALNDLGDTVRSFQSAVAPMKTTRSRSESDPAGPVRRKDSDRSGKRAINSIMRKAEKNRRDRDDLKNNSQDEQQESGNESSLGPH